MGSKLEITLYRDWRRQYRWFIRARNHKKLCNGGEGYVNRGDLVDALFILFGEWTVKFHVVDKT